MASAWGCQIGPGRLKSASFHYSDAVRVATAEQLLVNLVRLRYRDLPTFLQVSNISSQFELTTAVGADATVKIGGSDFASLGAATLYAERPTMTFDIMGGEEFQKRMLMPVKVGAISLLAESGWRGDRLFRVVVEKMNGVPNAARASGPTPAHAPRYSVFVEATTLLQSLGSAGLIDFEYETRYEATSDPIPIDQIEGRDVVDAAQAGVQFRSASDGTVQLVLEERRLVMRFRPRSDGHPDAERLRDLLRLKRGQRRYDIVAYDDNELDPFEKAQRASQLALDTRSLMGVLYFLSHAVRAPQHDVDAGVVTTTVDADGSPFDWAEVIGDLFVVRSSDDRPDNASVAVRHRDTWFYIADDDESSKSTFVLLNQLLALQAGDVAQTKPVLTLPVGR